jgi:hypothetical protein
VLFTPDCCNQCSCFLAELDDIDSVSPRALDGDDIVTEYVVLLVCASNVEARMAVMT